MMAALLNGPLLPCARGSAIARPGWTVNLALGRRGSEWDALEVGSVYQQTLTSWSLQRLTPRPASRTGGFSPGSNKFVTTG